MKAVRASCAISPQPVGYFPPERFGLRETDVAGQSTKPLCH
ncbi:hypothetical protein OHA88_13265 [Streptomyces sp. NBC_00353]